LRQLPHGRKLVATIECNDVGRTLVTVFASRSLPLPSGMGLQFCFGADLGPMHAAGRMVADVTVTT
jgi:hypothetical protein